MQKGLLSVMQETIERSKAEQEFLEIESKQLGAFEFMNKYFNPPPMGEVELLIPKHMADAYSKAYENGKTNKGN